jgi:hypothetical protein
MVRDGATRALREPIAKSIEGTLFPARIGLALAVLAIVYCRPLPAAGCSAAGKKQITFRCNYTAAPRSASERLTGARIVLNRALLSFNPADESHLTISLTFTNAGRIRVSDRPKVYLAIDDDTGANYLRRDLPAVDLSQIAPGEHITFSERLLSPAFRPGHYRISVWVPSAEPALKFDPRHNFMFSSAGVTDLSAGLNKLGAFTVIARDK